jgi:hypothetical protein
VSAEHDAMSRDSEQSRSRHSQARFNEGAQRPRLAAQSVKDLCVVFDSEYIVKHISSMSDKTKGLGRDRCRNTKKDRSTWQ